MINIRRIIRGNRTLLKNNITLVASSIIEKLLLFLTTVFLARYLGVAEYGRWGVVLSFFAIISIFSDLGLKTNAVKELSKDFLKIKELVGNVMMLKTVITILAIVIIVTLPQSFFGSDIKWICIMLLVSSIFNNIHGSLLIIFTAKQKMEYNSLMKIISAALMAIGYTLIIIFHQGLMALAIATVIIQAIMAVIVVFLVKKKFGLKTIIIKTNNWRLLIINSLPFGIILALNNIYFRIDMLMMSWMGSGEYQIGLYNSATRIIVNLLFLPTIFGFTIFPILSALKPGSRTSRDNYKKYVWTSFIIMIPIAIIIALFPRFIISIIFGKSFEAAALSLRILSLFLIFASITFIQKNYLGARGNLNITIKIITIGIILNILMNLYFIKMWGFIGASITTVISEFITMILLIIAIRRLDKMPKKYSRNNRRRKK